MTKAKVIQAANFRVHRLHPALIAGPDLTVRGDRIELIPVFFAQSQLDSACSHHMLASIFSILSLARPSALISQSHRRYGVSAAIFKQLREFWHTGITPEEFVERVNNLDLSLELTARFKASPDLDQFAIRNLMRGELVALSIASVHTRTTNHFTLGVGASAVQRGSKTETDTLLLLDASGSPPVFREYNAILRLAPPATRSKRSSYPELDASSRRKALNWSYSAPEWGAEIVRITSAIRFRLSG